MGRRSAYRIKVKKQSKSPKSYTFSTAECFHSWRPTFSKSSLIWLNCLSILLVQLLSNADMLELISSHFFTHDGPQCCDSGRWHVHFGNPGFLLPRSALHQTWGLGLRVALLLGPAFWFELAPFPYPAWCWLWKISREVLPTGLFQLFGRWLLFPCMVRIGPTLLSLVMTRSEKRSQTASRSGSPQQNGNVPHGLP